MARISPDQIRPIGTEPQFTFDITGIKQNVSHVFVNFVFQSPSQDESQRAGLVEGELQVVLEGDGGSLMPNEVGVVVGEAFELLQSRLADLAARIRNRAG